jgi:hypothetical protein
MAISTIVRKKMATLTPAQRADLRRRYVAHAQDVVRRGGTLLYPTGAMFFIGRRPDVHDGVPRRSPRLRSVHAEAGSYSTEMSFVAVTEDPVAGFATTVTVYVPLL